MPAVIVCSDFGAQENKICHCFHLFHIASWSACFFVKSLERFQILLVHFKYCPLKPHRTIFIVTNGLIRSGTAFKSCSNLTRWDTNMLAKPLRHFRKWSRQPHHAVALLWRVNPSCVAAFLIAYQGPQETGDCLVQLPSPETNTNNPRSYCPGGLSHCLQNSSFL